MPLDCLERAGRWLRFQKARQLLKGEQMSNQNCLGVGVPERERGGRGRGGGGLQGDCPSFHHHATLRGCGIKHCTLSLVIVSDSVCNNVKCCKLLSFLPELCHLTLCCTPSSVCPSSKLVYCYVGGQRVCPLPQQGAHLPEQTASALL